MEDDRHILAVLSCQDRARRGGGGGEVVLSPSSLTGKLPFLNTNVCAEHLQRCKEVCLSAGGVETSHRSSDCLVITIMELPEESPSSDSLSTLNVVGVYRPPSLDSLPCNLPAQKCQTWTSRSFPRCLLGALCLVSTCNTSQSNQSDVYTVLTGVLLCVSAGVLRLPASGDLPADDRPAVVGRGPGESGSLDAAAARPLWLLSVSVPRGDGGAGRAHAHTAVTITTVQMGQNQRLNLR